MRITNDVQLEHTTITESITCIFNCNLNISIYFIRARDLTLSTTDI